MRSKNTISKEQEQEVLRAVTLASVFSKPLLFQPTRTNREANSGQAPAQWLSEATGPLSLGCSKLDWTSPWAKWWVFKDRPAWSTGMIKRSPESLSNLKFLCYYMKSPAIDWPYCIIPISGNNCDTWVMVISVLITFKKKTGASIFTTFNISTEAFLICVFVG